MAANDSEYIYLNGLRSCDACSIVGQFDPNYPTYNLVMIGILMPLVGALGVVGNLCSAYIYSRPHMRTSTNAYLCALAFSDCCVILTALFLFFIEGVRRYSLTLSIVYGTGAPYIYPTGMASQTCSVYFTVAAAVDCFIGTVCPVRFRRRLQTLPVAARVVLLVVLLSLVYNVSHCFEIKIEDCWETRWNATSLQVCPTAFRYDMLYFTIYYTYLYTIFMAAGPLLLLIVLNVWIIIVLASDASHRRHADANGGGADGTGASGGDTGDSITLILVVCLFIFCNSLALIINFLEQTMAEKLGNLMNYFVDVSNLLVVCNSSANFIIYYSFGSAFRRTLRAELRRWRAGGRVVVDGHEPALLRYGENGAQAESIALAAAAAPDAADAVVWLPRDNVHFFAHAQPVYV